MQYIKLPDFITDYTTDKIHKRMRDNLSDDYDKSEGSHPWNLTRPFAYELAYNAQFVLAQAISLIWPEGAWGTWLDLHAGVRHMSRRKSRYMNDGIVLIEGEKGSIVPAGTAFSTPAAADGESILFTANETVEIGEDGKAEVSVTCCKPGTIGNVAANTVIVNTDGLQFIKSVTNPSAFTGGVDEESDEALKERIIEYDRGQDTSFVGNKSDYRRWAKEVPGVGKASVIPPDENPSVPDDSGIITLIVTDEEGNPADVKILADVYNHIMDPEELSETGIEAIEGGKTGYNRLAPPNVILRVVTPYEIRISIRVSILMDGTKTIEEIKESFTAAVKKYIPSAVEEGCVRYHSIGAIISNAPGVIDYDILELNGSSSNIVVEQGTLPTVTSEDIIITAAAEPNLTL
ncbi:MAG: baseplate J/gp47 family protein [bacterium]|nr:baseplate J/gp47 family protein [bacterium]